MVRLRSALKGFSGLASLVGFTDLPEAEVETLEQVAPKAKRVRKPKAVQAGAPAPTKSPKAPKAPKAEKPEAPEKAPNKEVLRADAIKAENEAAEAVARVSDGMALLIQAVEDGVIAARSARQVAAWLNLTYNVKVQAIKQFKHASWPDLDAGNACCADSKAILKEIDAYRIKCQELSAAASPSNINQTWYNIRKQAIAMTVVTGPNASAPRKKGQKKATEVFLKELLITGYKRGFAEKFPTEEAADATTMIGDALMEIWDIDLHDLENEG